MKSTNVQEEGAYQGTLFIPGFLNPYWSDGPERCMSKNKPGVFFPMDLVMERTYKRLQKCVRMYGFKLEEGWMV